VSGDNGRRDEGTGDGTIIVSGNDFIARDDANDGTRWMASSMLSA
jgi:hypothetical protein